MTIRAELADGRVLEFPDGTDPSVIQSTVKSMIAAEPKPQPEEGITAALTGGFKRFLSTGETALESLVNPELAAQRGVERAQRLGEQYAPGASLEKVKQAYAERGFFPAAREAISQIPAALAEQAPQIAATLGSAKLGAMAGTAVAPGVGTIIGGLAGATVPSLTQLYGSNLERQAQEESPEISRAKALAAAAPGAALEVASTFVPLGRNLVGKLLGPKAAQALSRGSNEAIERQAQESLTASLMKGTSVGLLAEIPTEVTQQMLERLQAGLPITDDEALKEYGEAAYGAGLVGGPFGAGARAVGRPAARAEFERIQQEEADRLAVSEEELAQRFPDVLPGGFKINREEVGREMAPEGFSIMVEGRYEPLSVVDTQEEADAKLASLTQIRENERANLLKDEEKINADIQKAKARLEQLEATEQTDTDDYKALKAELPTMMDESAQKIKDLYTKSETLSKPLTVMPFGEVERVNEQFNVIGLYGKPAGTFKTLGEAEASVQQAVGKDVFEQTQQRRETAKELYKTFVPQMRKFGLDDVGLNIVDKIENGAGGAYLDKLIRVSLEEANPIQTMRHESLHAMKDLGFFTPQQWRALEERANKEWIKTYLEGQETEIDGQKMSRLDGYKKLGYTQEAIVEEAIADAFGAYDKGAKPPPGMIAALFRKMKNFFSNIGQAFRGAGFQSADDIFQNIERGRVKPAEVIAPEAKAAEKLSLKQTTTPEFKSWFGRSEVIDDVGKPKVMYHGLAKDTTDFTRKTKRGAPIFLTDDPEFASGFAFDSYDQVAKHAKEYLNDVQIKQGIRKAVAQIKKDYRNDTLGKEMIASIQPGNLDAATPEAKEYLGKAFKDMLPSGPQVMPLYVRAERSFDYENPSHIRKVLAELGEGSYDPAEIRSGSWEAIEGADFQEAIQMAGFDSFYVKEQGRKNLAVYDANQVKSATGNVGTFSRESGDVRYSLAKPSSWKADKAEIKKADEYFAENGILPYTSEGQIEIELEGSGTKFSIKSAYTAKDIERSQEKAKAAEEQRKAGVAGVKKVKVLKNDPITGLPLNQNGTVTLYYPTTNEGARTLSRTKKLRAHSPEVNRIYLTNESAANIVADNPGLIDQPLGGANVLLQVDPSLLELAEEYSNGRKDFFIPIAEGQEFAKKMAQTKLFTLNAPRTKGLHADRRLSEVADSLENTVKAWQASDKKTKDKMFKDAKAVLMSQHNVSTLFGANAKLEKTNIGEYGLTYEGKNVMSTGLGLAAAQKISDKRQETTCPKSAICEALCLGETSGQNELYGGEGPFRSGPRLAQFLKTEAFIVSPEAFTTSLLKQIESFRSAAKKEGFYPAIRLNVTSDFPGSMLKPIIDLFPDVKFYDYTKLITAKPVAANHHLTYSSTGASQVVNGEVIVNKESNWDQLVNKVLPTGRNVAMAFSSRSDIPKFVLDEKTGKQFEVWNGDEYDARFLDPERPDGDGWIVGLTNKDRTTAPEDSAKKHNGFFLDYDKARDGDTLVIRDQGKLAGKPEKIIPIGKLSLKRVSFPSAKDAQDAADSTQVPNTAEFKRYIAGSQWVDEDGKAKKFFHATTSNFFEFNEGVIYLSDTAEESAKWGKIAEDRLRERVYKALNKDEKLPFFQQAVDEAVAKNKITEAQGKEFMRDAKRAIPEFGKYDSIKKEMDDVLLSLSPDTMKIMPLYARAMTPFDFRNKEHVKQVMDYYDIANVDREVSEATKEMIKKTSGGPSVYVDDILKGLKGILAQGYPSVVERQDIMKTIRRLGFDGYVVRRNRTAPLSYAVFKPEQVKSITGNDGQFSLETKDVRYSLRHVGYTPQRVEQLLSTYAYTQGGAEKDTKAYVGRVNPKDFLNATATREGLERIRSEVTPLDVERLMKEAQPIFLEVREGEYLQSPVWEIKGHEGRHRMMALADAGYDSVPVVFDFGNRVKDTKPIKRKYIVRQKFQGVGDAMQDLMVDNLVPVSYDQIDALREFEKTEGIKYSLPTLSKDTTDRMKDVTPQRYQPAFKERVIGAFKQDYTELRQSFLNRYETLGVNDRILRDKIRKAGGPELLADQSGEFAALQSDLSAGVAASAMGIGDRQGGVPIYRNGLTTIDTSVKGLVEALAPLAKQGDPEVYQRYQFWAGWKRGRRLLREGREDVYKPADEKRAREIEAAHPEFVQVQKDLVAFNNGIVKYAVQTGVLSRERAQVYTQYADYIPFYRQLDLDKTIGPNPFGGIAGVKGPKELKGGDAPLGDFLENMVRNTQSMINAGMKNAAAQKATNVALQIGEVTRLPGQTTGLGFDVYTQLENGELVYYRSADSLFIEALKSLNTPDLPFMGLLSAPANVLRNLVTKDPGFMMANLLRDSLSSYVTSGQKITPIVGTMVNFGKALSSKNKTLQALFNAGAIGGYEFSQNIEQSGQSLSDDLNKKAGKDPILLRPFKSLWEGLEKGTTASDAATRMAVYERVMAETGNEAEAISRALEVMNFNRKGNSVLIRIATAALPFFNARLQGLDLFYRASAGQMNTQDAQEIKRRFWIRGMTMASLSVMYYLSVADDEEYEKQEEETKDNNWIFTSLGIRIPIPFEVGTLFKTMPERITAYLLGNDTGKELGQSTLRALANTFAFNPIPQTFKPIVEVATNFNFFTMRPIVGQGMKEVEARFQTGPGTSKTAEAIGEMLNLSPLKVDQLIKGYTGTIGGYVTDVIDSMANEFSDVPKASKRFEQLPVVKRFALDPEARGSVTQFYELQRSVDTVVRTMSLLEKTARPEEYAKYLQDNIGVLAVKDYVRDIEKSMKELRDMRRTINSTSMAADEKRDILIDLGRAESNLTANIKEVKKAVSELK
jgi:hypothetical protein